MRPIALIWLMAFALMGGLISPSFADDVISSTRSRSAESAVPEFVPMTGRSNFKMAVNDNSASSKAARRAAEELGAKFSDITTGSVSSDAPSNTIQAEVQAPVERPQLQDDPPHVVTLKSEARTIVLSSKNARDARAAKVRKESQVRANSTPKRDHIPRNAIEQSSAQSAQGQSGPGSALAAIGEKVGFLNLLTNPALWK